jgi:hypothetical protein
VRTGLVLLAGHALLAQAADGQAASLTLAVSAKAGQGCGKGFPAGRVQQDLEERLRAAGLTVSRVHSATLAMDLDCTPTPALGSGALSVHQCLGLSQVVPHASHANGMSLATTWRQCSAYQCSTAKCESALFAAQRGLVDAFTGYLREVKSSRETTAPAVQQPQNAGIAEAPSVPSRAEGGAGMVHATLYVDVPVDPLTPRVVFFLLYIVTCFAVFARWQFGRQMR